MTGTILGIDQASEPPDGYWPTGIDVVDFGQTPNAVFVDSLCEKSYDVMLIEELAYARDAGRAVMRTAMWSGAFLYSGLKAAKTVRLFPRTRVKTVLCKGVRRAKTATFRQLCDSSIQRLGEGGIRKLERSIGRPFVWHHRSLLAGAGADHRLENRPQRRNLREEELMVPRGYLSQGFYEFQHELRRRHWRHEQTSQVGPQMTKSKRKRRRRARRHHDERNNPTTPRRGQRPDDARGHPTPPATPKRRPRNAYALRRRKAEMPRLSGTFLKSVKTRRKQ